MVLVDTPVWIDHLRQTDPALSSLLAENAVLIHPFVIGELALGNLRPGELALFKRLPQAISASHRELMTFIDLRSLQGNGVGYVDAHLLLAASLTPDTKLWTRDRRLRGLSEKLLLDAAGLD